MYLLQTGNVETVQGSELWTVEVYNGSDWVAETEITLGIGENLTDSTVDNQTTIRVRVLMPNVSSSWSRDGGHQVSVQLESDAGVSSSAKFDVMIPQTYGFELVMSLKKLVYRRVDKVHSHLL